MLSKKLLFSVLAGFAAIGLSTVAYADNGSGVYIGAQGGFAKADYGSGLKNDFQYYFPIFDSTSDGYAAAGRLYAGYQFNQYLALEGGFSLLPTNEYKGNDVFGDYADLKLKTNVWDIAGKAILPLSAVTNCPSPVSFYAKAGAAYVQSDAQTTLNGYSFDKDQNSWSPEAGVGVAFNVTNALTTDVSYTHVFGEDTNENPDVDFFGVGLNYRFPVG